MKILNTESNIPISVSHEVVTDPKTHQVHVHCKFEANGKSITHVLTIGSQDEILPASFTGVRKKNTSRYV